MASSRLTSVQGRPFGARQSMSEEDLYSASLGKLNQETLRHRRVIIDKVVTTVDATEQVLSDETRFEDERIAGFHNIRDKHLRELKEETELYKNRLEQAVLKTLPDNVRNGVIEYKEELLEEDREFVENANYTLASILKALLRYTAAAFVGAAITYAIMGICGCTMAAWTAIPVVLGGMLGAAIEYKFEVIYNAGQLIGSSLVLISRAGKIIGRYLLV